MNEILIKDLCARLPYGVKVSLQHEGETLNGTLYAVYPDEGRVIVDELDKAIAPVNVRYGSFLIERDSVKPYLRPMSSMTEEEYKELKEIEPYYGIAPFNFIDDWAPNYEVIDWLNAHHFDYRGLIEKGLAFEASKDMYK